MTLTLYVFCQNNFVNLNVFENFDFDFNSNFATENFLLLCALTTLVPIMFFIRTKFLKIFDRFATTAFYTTIPCVNAISKHVFVGQEELSIYNAFSITVGVFLLVLIVAWAVAPRRRT